MPCNERTAPAAPDRTALKRGGTLAVAGLALAGCFGAADLPASAGAPAAGTIIIDRAMVVDHLSQYGQPTCDLDAADRLPPCAATVIIRYQRANGLPLTGRLDEATLRRMRPDSAAAAPVGASYRLIPQPPGAGETVFVIDTIECRAGGAQGTLYEGVLHTVDGSAQVRIERRYAFRYHPNEQGIDRSSAACRSPRRYCFAPTAMTGLIGPGTVVTVSQAQPVGSGLGMVPALRILARRGCP